MQRSCSLFTWLVYRGDSADGGVPAVKGTNTGNAGVGVEGESARGWGVRGHSTSGPGVVATSETDYGLRAHSKSKAGLRSRDTAADTGLA